MMSNKILNELHNLINTNLEVQSVYKTAAEVINNDNLKEIFIIYIQKKAEYINELKGVAKELFGDKQESFPFERHTITLSDINEDSILKECESLEDKSIRNYESVLNDKIPSGIKETLLRQYNGSKEAKLHMKSLEGKF
jgi:uncharacterized protein (TIGR02284 family)